MAQNKISFIRRNVATPVRRPAPLQSCSECHMPTRRRSGQCSFVCEVKADTQRRETAPKPQGLDFSDRSQLF